MYANRRTGGALFLFAMLTLACSDDGLLAPDSPSDAMLRVQQAATPQRPFQGHFAGPLAVGDPCGAESWEMMLYAPGRGIATHLGTTTLDLSVCWNYADNLPAGPVSATYTAANGDEVAMTSTDIGFDPATGTMAGTYVIDGGTGRFRSAQGELFVTGQIFPDQTWESHVTGWIAY